MSEDNKEQKIDNNKKVNEKVNKKLIVFFDGTWNKPNETDDGKPCPTNVTKLFKATSFTNGEAPQVVHYVQGVGTHFNDFIKGGAFGWGISSNIKDGYRFICANYTPGDEIYLFGFSRGAYTARSLAGMIYNVGIVKRDDFEQIDEAYKGYRNRSDAWHPDPEKGVEAAKFREKYTYNGQEKIHFIGVWDTVGALGAPYGLVIGYLINLIFKCRFHDITLSPIIQSGYHALSEDEKRWPFRPTYWKLSDKHKQDNFEQEWFPGVHSDVGGGYKEAGLSEKTLEWMAEKAAQHGMKADLSLVLNPDPTEEYSKQHHSQTWYYRWPTLLFVKWPATLFVDIPGKVFKSWPDAFYKALNDYGIIAEPNIRQKVAEIQPNGDYHRTGIY